MEHNMDVLDETPFDTLVFESISHDGEPLQTVVVRASFDIVPGAILRPSPEQQAVVTADEYYGKPNVSSIRYPNDLAPYKPNADIIINATAECPYGNPAEVWPVRVKVGQLTKSFLVTGPRSWRKGLFGWKLGDLEPCSSVPIRYEYAYGGECEQESDHKLWERNPIGCGFGSPRNVDGDRLPAPQIVSQNAPIDRISEEGVTEGLGATAPAWLPRRDFAGDFGDGENWAKARAPLMPDDFKYDFFNAAHPDLIYDGFLQGGESVRLEGIKAEKLEFELPIFEFAMVITDKASFEYGSFGLLDTLHIDSEEMKSYMVWRITAPIFEDGVQRIHIKMRAGRSG